MTRVGEAFAAAKADGRAALVGYLTAFDPDRDASLARMLAACEAGLDVLELGVPFSDPNADGPRIQAAMVRALEAGATLAGVLELASEIRKRVATPIVLFSYANPLVRRGGAKTIADAKQAGVDALLVVDTPPEHAGPLRDPAQQSELDWIGLVAPTSTEPRIEAVAGGSSGFVYVVTLKGVTGAALDAEQPQLKRQLETVRAHTDLPIAAGFGVRTPRQAETLARLADGVVVGSALIEAAERNTGDLESLTKALRRAMERD